MDERGASEDEQAHTLQQLIEGGRSVGVESPFGTKFQVWTDIRERILDVSSVAFGRSGKAVSDGIDDRR